MTDTIWTILIVLAVLALLVGVLLPAFQIVKSVAVKSVVGIALLFLFDYVGGLVSFSLPFNVVTVLTAGYLGVPGILFLSYLQYLAR